MPRHSFIQMAKLTDLKGRIDYVTNPDRQENLYATYNTADIQFWKMLAKENQEDFKRSGTKGNCIEAREFIVALPENFIDYDKNRPFKTIVDFFKREYGVECFAGLHHNKSMSNYHIHMIFAERKLLPEIMEKIATRNMFFNEAGKHVRTKKEILDEDGEIRAGCTIIPKGEAYERHLFAPKIEYFKDKEFLNEAKYKLTKLINQYVKEEDKKLAVFDKSGPYLPTKKIGKNNPKERQIKADNEVRKQWNHTVDEALLTGLIETEIVVMKRVQISEKVKESIQTYGDFSYLFKSIVEAAINFLKEIISKFLVPPKPVFHGDMEKFNRMEEQRQGFMCLVKQIKTINGLEIQPMKARYELLNPVFKAKERKELAKKLNVAVMHKNNLELQLSSMIESAGYQSIGGFMEDYNRFSEEVSRYKEEVGDWVRGCRVIEIKNRYVKEQNDEGINNPKEKYRNAR
ncbi:MobA/MobL family protein [Anaerobium acetethylicum]|uniref:MobA/MobL family protein n=1 Tax=Anaerobium acetethylicum TaxID=1619234 RepID=A0A1D3TUZ1_9FIRM|nr:MobA/MobL family protein [Anaerobium acetethylicum]SCP97903.1 MobA/MobL family protein [Anaerobium acetethylicum]